jgi:hypothetical protein
MLDPRLHEILLVVPEQLLLLPTTDYGIFRVLATDPIYCALQ